MINLVLARVVSSAYLYCTVVQPSGSDCSAGGRSRPRREADQDFPAKQSKLTTRTTNLWYCRSSQPQFNSHLMVTHRTEHDQIMLILHPAQSIELNPFGNQTPEFCVSSISELNRTNSIQQIERNRTHSVRLCSIMFRKGHTLCGLTA